MYSRAHEDPDPGIPRAADEVVDAETHLLAVSLGLDGRTRARIAGRSANAAPTPSKVKRPSRYVQIFLAGGVDTLYFADPKVAAEVDSRVTIPYKPDEIIGADRVRLPPQMRALTPFLDRVAVVNGVIVRTVAHEYAQIQAFYMTDDFVTPRDVRLAGEIGSQISPSNDLWDVSVGLPIFTSPKSRSPRGKSVILDPALYKQLYKPSDDGLFVRSTEALRDQLKTTSDADTLNTIRTTLAFLERLDRSKPFEVPALEIKTLPSAAGMSAPELMINQRLANDHMTKMAIVFDLLSKNVVGSVSSMMYGSFDSHALNHMLQEPLVEIFSTGLAWLMRSMAEHKLEDGRSLLDDTMIIAHSELGRFPFLNSRLGKDHFPEIPILFAGGNIRPGNYGGTDKTLSGLPTSLTTGKLGGTGATNLTISDVGAAIRSEYGLRHLRSDSGRPLDFLFG